MLAARAWIGGEWVLADRGGAPPLSWRLDRFLAPHAAQARVALVASGRAALRLAIEGVAAPGDAVLLPAFGCPALTQAAVDAAATVVHYPGDALLHPHWPTVEALAHRHAARAVVVVHAFGVLQDADAVRRLARQTGAAIIEDCSHTLCNAGGWTHLGPPAAVAAIASLRKVLPVPSGGFCAIFGHQPADGTAGPHPGPWGVRQPPAPVQWVVASEGAPLPGTEAEWEAGDPFARARRAAFALPPGPARHRLLQRAEDAIDRRALLGAPAAGAVAALRRLGEPPPGALETWRRTCRANREELAAAVRATGCRPLPAVLPEGACPPGLVVRHANRTRLARHLLAQGIEATLHWPVDDLARPALTRQERLLAATILTLPCDGRCSLDDLRRVAEACGAG